jgi:hypothetical protein
MEENRERWMQLCEQAANEQDPEKLMKLVAEINLLLEAKQKRVQAGASDAKPAG